MTYDPTGLPTVLIAATHATCKECGFHQVEKIYGPSLGMSVDDVQAILKSRFRGWNEDFNICPECNGYEGVEE